MSERKVVSGGIAAIRKQIKSAIDEAGLAAREAKDLGHEAGLAYQQGRLAAYRHALALLHT